MALRLLRGEHAPKQLQQPGEGQRCVRQRDRSYDEHKAKCMAAVLPSVEASMREKEACRIVVEATNMSSAAFWTVTQEQLDLESKRALCLREALPDTPEADRAVAFRRAAQEANALTKRHTDLRQKVSVLEELFFERLMTKLAFSEWS
ncbi:hypothetical protein MRX96_046110 [Rhipicephalus microplus]